MKKEEFLEKLDSKLSILAKAEKSKIIKNYKTTITKRMNKQEKEKDIIESLGDIDILAQQILDEHGIKNELTKRGYFDDFFATINNLIDYLCNQSFKNNLKVIIELLLIIIFISFLKLPFILLRDLLLNFFDVMGVGYDSIVALLITRISDIIYIIFAVVLFISVFKKRFKKYQKNG